MRGVYSVFRYVPKPERGEAINVGLILISSNGRRVWLQFSKPGSFSGFPQHLRPPKELLDSVQSYARSLQERTRHVEPLTFLSDIHHDLENNIQTSEPHPCKFDNAATFMAKMYEMVVSPPSNRAREHQSRR